MRGEGRLTVSGELAARLRGIRKRAGLTQAELATRMGRPGRNYAGAVARLETGKTPGASLMVVADFLRACRAGFIDILGLLEDYTRRPPVHEERAARAIEELEERMAADGLRLTTDGRDADRKKKVTKGTHGTHGTGEKEADGD